MIKPGKIIVAGGTAAGPAAAAKAKRVNPDAEVLLFEAGDFISTGTCEIPYVISGEVDNYKDIIYFSPESFKEKKGVEVFINHSVEEIDRSNKTITVKNIKENKIFKESYDKLILATGSVSKKLSQFPEKFSNVIYLKTVNDLLGIQSLLKNKKIENVIIIGSGYIGLEAADAFKYLNYNVTIIEKEELPLPYTEPEIQYLIAELLKQKEIRFFGKAENYRVNQEKNEIKSITLDGRIIDADLVLVSVGFEPNNVLAKNAGLELGKKGGIKVDKKLRTTDQHIYAAGDNIEIINAVTNRSDYFPLATVARDYGHAAGENAAGGNVFVNPVVKNISVKVLNKFHVIVGLSSKEAEENNLMFDSVYEIADNIVQVMPGSEKVFGKIIYEKSNKRILGAAFFGGKEVSGYADLISALIKIKQPADFLAQIDYNYTPPLSPFINLLSKLGRKIK